jgi:hypothetical protein
LLHRATSESWLVSVEWISDAAGQDRPGPAALMSLKNSLEVASSRSAASQRSTAEELLEDVAIAVAREGKEGSCSLQQ